MKIIVLKNKEVGKKAASIIANEIIKKPSLVIGLATGKTMIPFYKSLVSLYKKRILDFSKIITFNLDEYLGIDSTDPNSLRYYMNKHFFSKINIKEKNINFLEGKSKNINLMCRHYESKIKRIKIDIQILGIGKNGHIGFNEPGSKFNSGTRKVKLTNSTIKHNFKQFNSKIPKYAVTMGIKDITNARKIILLASGRNKAKVIAKTVNGPISTSIPASILQCHNKSIFIVDKSAASKLNSK